MIHSVMLLDRGYIHVCCLTLSWLGGHSNNNSFTPEWGPTPQFTAGGITRLVECRTQQRKNWVYIASLSSGFPSFFILRNVSIITIKMHTTFAPTFTKNAVYTSLTLVIVITFFYLSVSFPPEHKHINSRRGPRNSPLISLHFKANPTSILMRYGFDL